MKANVKIWLVSMTVFCLFLISNIYMACNTTQNIVKKMGNNTDSSIFESILFDPHNQHPSTMTESPIKSLFLETCKNQNITKIRKLVLDHTHRNRSHPHFVIDPKLGRFDRSRKYKIFDHVYVGKEYKNLITSSPVCLASQASIDQSYWLEQVSAHWEDAPISVALFVPDVEYGIARAYLNFLLTCYPHLAHKLSVHFIFPFDKPPNDTYIDVATLMPFCSEPKETINKLMMSRSKQMQDWREEMKYPQNLMRNIARKNCGTEWIFLTDLDIIPSVHQAPLLKNFLLSEKAVECKKCAFVIPTYEVDHSVKFPNNRKVLLQLKELNKAQMFHKKIYVLNQRATNLLIWEKREKMYPNETDVTVSHKSKYELYYEPFYVARDDVPPHDERFIGYGYTRNTQVYEMFLAEFEFLVLSPIFAVHWGLQSSVNRSADRISQNKYNRELFNTVVKLEFFARYKIDPLGMMSKKKNKSRKKGRQ